MAQQLIEYDTSDYPQNHHLYSMLNKKVSDQIKDEYCGKIIDEFIGLRSKM